MNPESPCPEQECVRRFMCGQASSSEVAGLSVHLNRCAHCRALIRAVASSRDSGQTNLSVDSCELPAHKTEQLESPDPTLSQQVEAPSQPEDDLIEFDPGQTDRLQGLLTSE